MHKVKRFGRAFMNNTDMQGSMGSSKGFDSNVLAPLRNMVQQDEPGGQLRTYDPTAIQTNSFFSNLQPSATGSAFKITSLSKRQSLSNLKD